MNAPPLLGLGLLTILVLICFGIIYSRFTFVLDFGHAFTAVPQPPPQLSMKLNGVSGDSAIVGFDFDQTLPAEELTITPQMVDTLRSNLNGSDLQRWELVTKLPSSIFKFKAWVISDVDSPNKSKKASYFVVTIGSSTQKVLPGTQITLKQVFEMQDITQTIPTIKIALYYDGGIFNNFYATDGSFVSQSTGKLLILPTPFTAFLIFAASWVLVLAFIVLIKQTVTTAFDLDPIASFLTKL